jgi:hypothetical protein
MKNRSALFGIISIILIFGFILVGCDIGTGGEKTEGDDTSAFVGTWKSSDNGQTLVLTKDTFTRTTSSNNVTTGPYTIKDGEFRAKSSQGTWSGVWTLEVVTEGKEFKLSYKSGATEIGTGTWTKQ